MLDRQQIIALAAKHRLPAVYEWPEQVHDGGLMAYGTSRDRLYIRLATYVGFAVALVALMASVVILYVRVVMGVIGVSGFSTLIISVLFLGSIQLISVGILGEYIGRIYDEVKRRPIYIVKEMVGFTK